MNNPLFYNIGTFRTNQTEEKTNPTLKWLAKRVIAGVEFDSLERDPPPRCHPQTRLSLRARISAWFRDQRRSNRLLWLSGPAGAGKSAVMQTLAESEYEANALGATLFFSRLNNRNNPQRAVVTLAYQFAIQIPSYQSYIKEQMIANPRLLEKGLKEQFKKLIVEPFGQRSICQGEVDRLILLDGLDECEGEQAQCEIIELINELIAEFPTAPLVWIVASRPEPHLKFTFSNAEVKDNHVEEQVPIDTSEACQDVERYLREEFRGISRRYPYSISPSFQWPTESQFLAVATAASGLFAFASTSVRFIDDIDIGDPESQLDYLLSFIADMKLSPEENNPLSLLDSLYTRILSSVPPASLDAMKLLLGYSLIDEANYSFLHACNILGLKRNVAYGALQRLHSVLQVPQPDKAEFTKLSWYHASFADFLRDPRRSQEFAIDILESRTKVWWCFFRILQQTTDTDLPTPQTTNIVLSWPSVHPQWTSENVRSQLHTEAIYHFVPQLLSGLAKGAPPSKISISLQQRYDVLAQFNFRMLPYGYMSEYDDPTIFKFIPWLASLSDEPSLREKDLFNEIPLSDAGSDDWIENEDAVCIWLRFLSSAKNQYCLSSDRPLVLDKVRKLKRRYPSTVALVCGATNARRCLIVKGRRKSVRWEDIFVLPYR